MKHDTLDRVIACSSTIGSLFFSYVPTLVISNLLNVARPLTFMLLTSGIGLAILVRFSKNVTINFEPSALTAFCLYGLFACYAIARFALSTPNGGGDATLFNITVFNLLFVALALYVRPHKQLIVETVLILSSVYVLLAAYSVFVADLAPGDMFSMLGVDGLFYQNISTYLGLFAVAASCYLGRSSLSSLSLGFLIISALTAMLLVGGRAAFTATLLVLIANVVYALIAIPRARYVALLTCYFALGSGVLVIAATDIDVLVLSSHLSDRFAALLEGQDASMRIFLFSSALELFTSDIGTVFFGAGINSYPESIRLVGAGWYPHNIVLELLAEYGALGCVLFLLPILYTAYQCFRRFRASSGYDRSLAGTSLLATYFFLIACVSGNIATSWVLLFFAVLNLPTREHPLSFESLPPRRT